MYFRPSQTAGWVDVCIMKADGLDVTSIEAEAAIRLSSRMLEEALRAKKVGEAAQRELSVEHPDVRQ